MSYLMKHASFADFARSGTRGAAIGAASGALLGAAGNAGLNVYHGKNITENIGSAALLGAGAGGVIGMGHGLGSHNNKMKSKKPAKSMLMLPKEVSEPASSTNRRQGWGGR